MFKVFLRSRLLVFGVALVAACTKTSIDQVIEVDGKVYRVTRVVSKQSTSTEEYYELKAGAIRRECDTLEGCRIILRGFRPDIREQFEAGAPVVQPTQTSSTPPLDQLLDRPQPPAGPLAPKPKEWDTIGE